MSQGLKVIAVAALLCLLAAKARAQSDYQTVQLTSVGTIAGTVKWSGPEPHALTFPVNKDPQICDPESHKRVDLERLVIGSQGGVANSVVFLQDITKGKPMTIASTKPLLDQKRCRYEPHIVLVPKGGDLQMKSSDATLHTMHMEGAATYNLPFPFPNKIISRTFSFPGLATVKCNGGHVWMNAELFVVPHPYYVVTDESGKFELTDVPPGEYELVAWHEGWGIAHQERTRDVLTQQTVERPVFTEPKTWHKKVTVSTGETTQVNFVISEK